MSRISSASRIISKTMKNCKKKHTKKKVSGTVETKGKTCLNESSQLSRLTLSLSFYFTSSAKYLHSLPHSMRLSASKHYFAECSVHFPVISWWPFLSKCIWNADSGHLKAFKTLVYWTSTLTGPQNKFPSAIRGGWERLRWLRVASPTAEWQYVYTSALPRLYSLVRAIWGT